ncbi:MAG TPA: DUF4386 domain-containing protein [Terracidiphilus sp.]|nr:DUF4386 domain-containing protein [Terracidiphilus sp.]
MSFIESMRAATPKTKARFAGAVYFTYFILAFTGAAFDPHGAVARFLNVVSLAIYAVLTMIFYFMFKPVSKSVSLLAALTSLAGCIFSVMQMLQLTRYVISPLIFFGCYCLLLGQLVIRSGFLPRILGALLVVAGVGWLLFLFPFAKPLATVTEVFGILAEGALCLWLLIAGVSPARAEKPTGGKKRA